MPESVALTPSPRNEMLRLLATWIIAASLVLLSVSVAYSTFFDSTNAQAQIVVQPAQPQIVVQTAEPQIVVQPAEPQIVVQPAQPQVHVQSSFVGVESALHGIESTLSNINSVLRRICAVLSGSVSASLC